MFLSLIPAISWLRWLPLLLALLLGLWLGYAWGGRELDAVRAELATIKGAESTAKHEFDATAERLKAQAAEAEAQHKVVVQKIEATFANNRKQLQTSLEHSEERLAKAQRERSDTSAELRKVRANLATSDGADKEILQRREAELVEREKRMKLAEESLQCLKMQVPPEELGILNQQRGL